jgi:fructose-1,6-bisphosphatase II
VAGAINTCFPESGVDVLMNTGGAPEGVIGAAALRCMGGDMQGRLVFRNEQERERARSMGGGAVDRVLRLQDLAGGDVMFAATGVTNGDFLRGVRYTGDGARTHSVVMRSRSGTVRYIEAEHHFQHKPNYGW